MSTTAATEHSGLKKKKIIVTAFGPFGSYEENPSSVVIELLATAGLPEDVAKNIKLVTHVIPVEYSSVEKFSQTVVQDSNADFVIHVGVHPVAKCVKIEQQSLSHGYCGLDIAGKIPENQRSCYAPECGVPESVETVLDCDKLIESVTSALPKTHLTIKTSTDPGNFLCAYVYYSTLKCADRRSLFVHVPVFDEDVKPDDVLQILIEIVKHIASVC